MYKLIFGAMVSVGLLAISASAVEPQTPEKQPNRNPAEKREKNSDQLKLLSSNKLMGATIYNKQDESIASVNSVVLNSQGEALFVIAGVGGVAGVGQTEIAVPWNALQCTCLEEDGSRTCRAELPMSAEQLKNAPALKSQEYAELGDQAWIATNAKFYSAKAPVTSASLTDLICLRTVNNAEVQDIARNDIGQLDAVMMNMVNGRAVYGIIGYGGVAQVGKSYVAVPYESMKFQHDKTEGTWTVMAPLSKQTLESSPKVTPSDYPELDLESFRDQVKETSAKTKPASVDVKIQLKDSADEK